MRIRALALFILTILFGTVSSAFAQDTSVTVYSGLDSSYGFQNLGITVEEKPTFILGATKTYENVLSLDTLALDVWTSTATKAKGPYGNRGAGDEIDFTMTGTKSVSSPIGPLAIEGQLAYWVIADFGRVKDDIVGAYLQVGRPVAVETATVTPYVRLTEWIGLGDYPDTFLVRPGIGVSIPLTKSWSLTGDVSHVKEDAFGLKTWRGELGLTRSFENDWSITGSVKVASRMDTVFGFRIARTYR